MTVSLNPGANDSITCLAGASESGRKIPADLGSLNRGAVPGNEVILGSVNANRRHYDVAVAALTSADQDWLRRLTTRHHPLHGVADAFSHSQACGTSTRKEARCAEPHTGESG